MSFTNRSNNKELIFQKLFEENYSEIYTIALYIVNDSEVAKDLTEDLFAQLWESFNPTHVQFNKSYFHTIIKNKSLDYLKHNMIKNKYARLYIEMNRRGQLDQTFEDYRINIIEEIMETMPDKTRFIFQQCYFQDMKYDEVAEILGLSRDGVRKHIMKALSMIRKVFSVKYKKGQVTKMDT